MAEVWNGRIVSESALTSRINSARTAIGDSGEEQRLIKTLRGKGFRFVGVVSEEQRAPGAAGVASQPSEPHFSFAGIGGSTVDRRAAIREHGR